MGGRLRTLPFVVSAWLLALVVALIATEQTSGAAVMNDASVACAEAATCVVPSPAAIRALASPKPAARKPSSRPERRMILLRPPYDLKRRQVALTCGYHDSCKRRRGVHPVYAAGTALDWNDNNGTVPETRDVVLSLSAFAARPHTRIGTVTWEYHKPGRGHGYPCSTLVAVVRSYPKPVELFRVMYQHVVPVRWLRPVAIFGDPPSARPANNRPNVVVRVASMSNDPCAYFTRTADGRPLFHVHVEPQSHNFRVAFALNQARIGRRTRVIPDVNGCREACSGPAYPGPRFQDAYWKLWTARWVWRANPRTGVLA